MKAKRIMIALMAFTCTCGTMAGINTNDVNTGAIVAFAAENESEESSEVETPSEDSSDVEGPEVTEPSDPSDGDSDIEQPITTTTTAVTTTTPVTTTTTTASDDSSNTTEVTTTTTAENDSSTSTETTTTSATNDSNVSTETTTTSVTDDSNTSTETTTTSVTDDPNTSTETTITSVTDDSNTSTETTTTTVTDDFNTSTETTTTTYSSMVLTNFQTLHHMGGVVVPNEEEKLGNLFKLIITEISSRKQRLKAIGVSSYTAYKEAGKNDMPIILLIIDNFAALKERYLGDSNTTLLTILREGLSVGISVVVANGSTKGMEKYLQYFSCRVGFYHNNSEEYGNLFGVFKMTGDAIPGRGKISIERAVLDCQFYLSFKGEKEIDRIREIEAFCKEMNSKNTAKCAPLIPVIPEVLMENAIRKEYSAYYSSYDVILGFDYATLQPKRISLSGLNLIVSGIPDSGKGNFAKYIISCLERNKTNAPAEIVIFDRASIKKFESIAQTHAVVSRYEMSPVNMATICQEWKAELEQRKQIVLNNNGDMSVLQDKPLLLMICEDSSKELLDGFDENLFKYFPYKFSWIVSSLENIKLPPINAPKLYKAKNAGASFMFFGNMAASKCMDEYASIQPPDKSKWNAFEMEQGDAFYVEAQDSTKIYRLKTVLHQDPAQE